MSNLNIIFETEDFLILNKPGGVMVHPTKYEKENTLVQSILEHYPFIANVGQAGRPGIVHRLDKDVSGLLVVAKNNYFYNYLISEFKKERVKKKYIGLVYGRPLEKKGIIDVPIGWTKKGKIVAGYTNLKLSKPAKTKYKTLKEYQDFTLLEISPLSGRTHQIRTHLSYIKIPIVGDKDYKFKNQPILLNRLFLHCIYLSFYQPNGKFLKFKCPLPSDLQNFLNTLK